MNNNLKRVNNANPCPICNKPDWCNVSSDGAVAICMRIAERAVKTTKNGGFLHRLTTSTSAPHRRTISLSLSAVKDFSNYAARCQLAVDAHALYHFATQLGLSVESLKHLGIGYSDDYRAWSFPMTDINGHVCGIRLRRDGRKFAVMESKDGLFLPKDLPQHVERLLIVEGPTDTAAVLDMGSDAVIGRPSCMGGIKLIVEVCQHLQPVDVVVLADNDEPGQRGANNLASVLVLFVKTVRVITPPDGIKDVREWFRQGGCQDDVQAVIMRARPRTITISRKTPI